MELWNKCSEKLENTLSQEDFNTWIRPLKAKIDKNTLELVAPNDFILDYIEKNYSKEIKKIVKSQSKSNINLVFKTLTKETFIDKYKNNQNSEIKLVDGYTFDSFVEGKSNHLALAAAKQVAANPKGDYNPLFIYGGVGLGKTHLMHAIAHEIKKRKPLRRVIYMSAEKFMYYFIKALRFKNTVAFKEQFRNVDVLMIDDVQFISGKDSTQEEFFHTFNALIDQNKQLIISADKSPQDLEGIEERMRSRLGWGLVADIHPLTYELRLGILQAKEEKLTASIPPNILEFLAHKITSNVRELEGALNRLSAFSSLVGREINLDMVQDLLKDLLKSSQRKVNIEEIQKKVSQHFNVKMSDMSSSRRSRTVARPRQIAMYLSKNLTSRSLPEIGRRFGNRDHTTVIHAVRKVEELRNKDVAFDEDVQLLIRMLES